MGCVHSSYGKKTNQDSPTVSPSKTRQVVRDSGAFRREASPGPHDVPLPCDHSGTPTVGTSASTRDCEIEARYSGSSPPFTLVGGSLAQEDSIVNTTSSSSEHAPPRKKHRYSIGSSAYFQRLRCLTERADVPMVPYPSTSTPNSQVSMKNLDETLRSLHSIVTANAEKLSFMESYVTACTSLSSQHNLREDFPKSNISFSSAMMDEQSPTTLSHKSSREVTHYNP